MAEPQAETELVLTPPPAPDDSPPPGIWRSGEPPEGPIHVCFSGGRTSAYMVSRLVRDFGGTLPERVKVVFANTGREMPQTLDFVRDVGEQFGVDVVWVEWTRLAPFFRIVDHASASRDGEPFEELIERNYRLPGPVWRFCTARLKVQAAQKFCESLGWPTWTQAVGIRADEARRLRGPGKRHWTCWYPLAEWGITLREITAFWKGQNFDLRLPNFGGKNWLGNCDGCFLKSEAAIAALTRSHPERAKWWERMEAKSAALRKSKRGHTIQWSRFGTRKDLRERIAREGDGLFDLEGFFCQADGGECTG